MLDQAAQRDGTADRSATSAAAPKSTAAPIAAGYRERYQRNKRRLGRQRGAKVAQIDIAKKLTEAIWHMLTNDQPLRSRPGRLRFSSGRLTALLDLSPGAGLQCRLVLPPSRP